METIKDAQKLKTNSSNCDRTMIKTEPNKLDPHDCQIIKLRDQLSETLEELAEIHRAQKVFL